jgi:hypothetical protein
MTIGEITGRILLMIRRSKYLQDLHLQTFPPLIRIKERDPNHRNEILQIKA